MGWLINPYKQNVEHLPNVIYPINPYKQISQRCHSGDITTVDLISWCLYEIKHMPCCWVTCCHIFDKTHDQPLCVSFSTIAKPIGITQPFFILGCCNQKDTLIFSIKKCLINLNYRLTWVECVNGRFKHPKNMFKLPKLSILKAPPYQYFVVSIL